MGKSRTLSGYLFDRGMISVDKGIRDASRSGGYVIDSVTVGADAVAVQVSILFGSPVRPEPPYIDVQTAARRFLETKGIEVSSTKAFRRPDGTFHVVGAYRKFTDSGVSQSTFPLDLAERLTDPVGVGQRYSAMDTTDAFAAMMAAMRMQFPSVNRADVEPVVDDTKSNFVNRVLFLTKDTGATLHDLTEGLFPESPVRMDSRCGYSRECSKAWLRMTGRHLRKLVKKGVLRTEERDGRTYFVGVER